MNHILNQYLPFLMKSPLFLSILDIFWKIFGHFSYSTSTKESLTIELNYLLNWISRIFFELNNILNWILGKAILNRILNESFFGKIQKLNWIRLGIGHHYLGSVSGVLDPFRGLQRAPKPKTRPILGNILTYFDLPWPPLPTRANFFGSKWLVHLSHI